ncbi:MAG: cupredoxin family copper-binding protein [Anaerolineae bacterium]|nr:cupredoxin family copper-binding protein [Anaerolineae bacterium]
MPHSRIPVRSHILLAWCLGLGVLALAVLGLLLVPAEHARAAQTTFETGSPQNPAQGGPDLDALRRQMRQYARQHRSNSAPLAAAPAARPDQTGAITGRLVAGTTGVANTPLTLRRYRPADNLGDAVVMTATTSTTGTFVFAAPPTPPTGYAYYVEFGPQTSNPNLAYLWDSDDLTNYTAGQEVAVGTLDVANVPLIAPANNATVSFPVTFEWTPRAHTTDNYVVFHEDLSGNYAALSGPLGHTDSFTATSASGIRLDEAYFWGIYIDNTADNGSFGLSQRRTITFTEAPAQVTGTATATVAATSTVQATGTPTPTSTTSVCQSGTVQINIQNFAFVPQTVTVCQGATVRWTNLDTVPHTSTSDTNVWDSGTLNTGQSFSFTFNTTGSFPYHCAIHPNMLGTIHVVAEASATETATRTATAQATGTATPAATGTATAEATGTATPAATGTSTPEATGTATVQVTGTAQATGTATPEATSTSTAQATSTATAQATGTATAPPTATATLAPTSTATLPATGTPTATVTATAQPTRTATLAPTSTATVRPTSTPITCGSGNLCAGVVVVRAFIDFGCDGFFNRGTDYPLYGATVTATLPDGTRLVSIVDENGNAVISGINLAATDAIQVSIDSPPLPTWVQQASLGLAPCGTSPTTLTLQRSNFGLFGVAFTDFRFGLTQP